MHKAFLLTATLATVLAPGVARTVSLRVPETADATATAALPSRGMTQAAVLKALGEPALRHAPVGGGHPRRPPITRWDYSGYSVFFEHDRVIDVVVQDAPAPLHNVDELKREP